MAEYIIVGDALDIACLIALVMVATVVALMVKASR